LGVAPSKLVLYQLVGISKEFEQLEILLLKIRIWNQNVQANDFSSSIYNCTIYESNEEIYLEAGGSLAS
jgi:hypothetical protein